MRSRLGLFFVGLAMCLVVVAGVAKLLDLPSFHRSLSSWVLLPAWSHWIVTFFVPIAELALAGSWFLTTNRRAAELGALGLLASFLLMLTVHVAISKPPNCQCFGLIDAYFKGLQGAKMIWGRTIAIFALLTAGMLLGRFGATPTTPPLSTGLTA